MEPAEDILKELALNPKTSLDHADVNALIAQLEKASECINSGRTELAYCYVKECLIALQAVHHELVMMPVR